MATSVTSHYSTKPTSSRIPEETQSTNALLYINETHSSEINLTKYKLHWIQISSSTTVIFSAYYNNRKTMYGNSVIILGHQSVKTWKNGIYCKLYYANGDSTCLKRISTVELANTCNKYVHYTTKEAVFHICLLQDDYIPSHVSLSVNKDCSRTSDKLIVNSVRIPPEDRKEFGVCIQTPLYGKETVQNVYEFIEIHKILGVDIFTIYSQINRKGFTDGLKVYEDENILDYLEWPTTFKRDNILHYYGEVLTIHDCLYRNMYRVKYLALVDLDEVIVPSRYYTWNEMINSLMDSSTILINGFVFNNVNIVQSKTLDSAVMQRGLCSDIAVPKYLSRLTRYACDYQAPRRSKVIVIPERVTHLDIHAICYLKDYHKKMVSSDVGMLFHYRNGVPVDCKNRTIISANQMLRYETHLLDNLKNRFCSN